VTNELYLNRPNQLKVLSDHDRALQRAVLFVDVIVKAAIPDRVQIPRFALLARFEMSDLIDLSAVRVLGMRV